MTKVTKILQPRAFEMVIRTENRTLAAIICQETTISMSLYQALWF